MPAGRWTSWLPAPGCATCELCGESLPFPANGYRGDYMRDSPAQRLLRTARRDARAAAAQVLAGLPADEPRAATRNIHIDALIARCRELIGESGFRIVLDLALSGSSPTSATIWRHFGVEFDRWYSERHAGPAAAPSSRALAAAASRRASSIARTARCGSRPAQFGDEKDRVVVRENGITTYFASDIAYHLDKRERGFSMLLYVLGADHHGYVARVRAGLTRHGRAGREPRGHA